MTTLPSLAYLDEQRTEGAMKSGFFGPILDVIREIPGGAAGTTLSVTDSAITPSQAMHYVDTGGGTVTVDTINAGPHVAGRLLLLRPAGGGTVTFRHFIGASQRVYLSGGHQFDMAAAQVLLLYYDGLDWLEILRGPSGWAVPLITAADAATARGQLGVAAKGEQLLTSADAATARDHLGLTGWGYTGFADAATARAALNIAAAHFLASTDGLGDLGTAYRVEASATFVALGPAGVIHSAWGINNGSEINNTNYALLEILQGAATVVSISGYAEFSPYTFGARNLFRPFSNLTEGVTYTARLRLRKASAYPMYPRDVSLSGQLWRTA